MYLYRSFQLFLVIVANFYNQMLLLITEEAENEENDASSTIQFKYS